jgi:hypothetical protein
MRLPIILALGLLAPRALSAQAAPRGRIEGQLTDSVHARPVAGASVIVIRVRPDTAMRIAVTDEKGRFQFDSLIAGSYTIEFNTPFLDSLEVTLVPKPIALGPDEHLRVELAVPSGATLRAGGCPGLALPQGKGAIVGQAVDADTDKPLIGAVVAVSWTDLTVNRATLQPQVEQKMGAMPVDSLGQFRLCGVPTDSYVLVQLQYKGRVGSTLRLSVPDDAGIIRRDLSLSAGASREIAALDSAAASGSDGVPPKLLTGTSTLIGTVRGAAGQPLQASQVRVLDAAGSTLTDSAGRFMLANQPAGTQLVEVRRIGYLLGTIPVELRSGRTTEENVTLQSIVSLDSIRVTARRSRYREYERRARRGAAGRFMSEQDIEKKNAYEMSDIVRMLPGFRIVGSGVNAQVVSSRGRISFRQEECATNVVIDGMQHQDINLLHPSDVGALEAYSGSGGAPMQYDSACGVIVVWTKR